MTQLRDSIDHYKSKSLGSPTQKLFTEFKKMFSEEIRLGQEMAEIVRERVNDIRGTEELTNQTKGSLHTDSLIRNLPRSNGQYFSSQTMPIEEEFCKMSIIVDNSGSMYSYNRTSPIEYAKRATALLATFCEELQIPYSINFFSNRDQNIEICDFNKPRGELEKSKIANADVIESLGASGTELLYPLVELKQKLENTPDALGNILIVISDGQTNDSELCITTMKDMQEQNNLEPIILTFDASGAGSVRDTWLSTIQQEAKMTSKIEGFSEKDALLDAAEWAADTIVDVPVLKEAPEILGDLLVDKIKYLADKTGM